MASLSLTRLVKRPKNNGKKDWLQCRPRAVAAATRVPAALAVSAQPFHQLDRTYLAFDMTPERAAHADRRMALLQALEPFDLALRCMPNAVSEYATTLYGLLLSLPRNERREVVDKLLLLVCTDLH
jgi:hypothetical protein